MEIYTNAPSGLDYPGCKEFGDFGIGLVRVVSISGAQSTAMAQIRRYTECGFFASLYRNDAIAFMTQQGGFDDLSVSDCRLQVGEGAS